MFSTPLSDFKAYSELLSVAPSGHGSCFPIFPVISRDGSAPRVEKERNCLRDFSPKLGYHPPHCSPLPFTLLSLSRVRGPGGLQVLQLPWFQVLLAEFGAQGLGGQGPMPALHGAPEATRFVSKGSAVPTLHLWVEENKVSESAELTGACPK